MDFTLCVSTGASVTLCVSTGASAVRVHGCLHDFWKTELKPRIVEMETFDQAEFPGAYCYVASEWADGEPLPLVLLEMYH